MPYTTPDADARRTSVDAVIFDMDGVLLDISGSIRVVNCLSVPYYLRTVLGWPAPDDLLTSDDIEMFKNAAASTTTGTSPTPSSCTMSPRATSTPAPRPKL